jgi:hypothetical protein
MFCRNCGNQIEEGSQFCGACGTPVEQTRQSVTVQQASADDGKAKGKAGLIAGLVGGGIVLLAAAAAGIFLLLSRTDVIGENTAAGGKGTETADEEESGDEYPVRVCLYSAEEVRTTEDGNMERPLIAGKNVNLRVGAGAYTGEIYASFTADENGSFSGNLPSGVYTAEIEADGYIRTYIEVEVSEQETEVSGYLIPSVKEGSTGIVLAWDGEGTDLDLTLFTPYQGSGGDMAHIGGSVLSDSYGNEIISDNTAGCEVAYINTAEVGSYKLYVNDYTDSLAGNYTKNLNGLNIHIYIYNSNGFVAEYTFPTGEKGVVWEAAEIRGETVTPVTRVYSSLDGKQWWTQSKEKKQLVEKITYDADGSISGWNEYEYDSAGNKVKEITYLADGILFNWTEYEYDSRGNLTRENIHAYDTGIEKYIYEHEYEYDSVGNQTKATRYKNDGSIAGWTEYEYDSHGNQTKETIYGNDGSISGWYEYEYDSVGNLTKEIWYNGDDGSSRAWTEYEYDSAGNMTLETSQYENGSLRYYECEYDNAGKLMKKTSYYHDSLDVWWEYEYDSAGYMTKETYYGFDGSLSSWTEYIYE